MKRLEAKARFRLDRYVEAIHSALGNVPREDRLEVERDVRAHIESALAGAAEPVGIGALQPVLDTLGAPEQWAACAGYDEIEDRPAEAAVTTRAFADWVAPEWHLAYASLGLFVLAFALPPFLWIGLLAAFLMARASLCAIHRTEPRGWLVMPALLCLYVPAVVVVLLWPAIAMRLLADQVLLAADRGVVVDAGLVDVAGRIAEIRLTNFDPITTTKAALRSGHFLTAPVGAWMIVLGLWALAFRGPVRGCCARCWIAAPVRSRGP